MTQPAKDPSLPQFATITLSGNSDAKGRNGYYKLRKVEVWQSTDGTTYVDFQSSRGTPSARALFTADDWLAFQAFIAKAKS